MDQLKQLLQRLTLQQRISIVAGVLAMGGALFYVTRWSAERDFKPLFSSLSAEDAGAIVQKLKESGVDYRLGETGASVLVPSARVSELRLELASAGIPKTGRIGFELFDKNNLGLTDFSEHVNYRRALEGELERSIMSITEVEQARVHITFPKESVFTESRQSGKASVLVRLRPGQALKPANVMAVAHLVASAVEGLQADAVAVLDMHGNLLNRPRRGKPGEEDGTSTDANIEYRQQVEKLLLEKVNSTLEPLLGHDAFRASVSAECNFSSGEESQENFDPSKSVMVSSRKTEDISNGVNSSGIPGIASNLPRAPERAGASGTGGARRTEDVQYQSSRLVRRTSLPKGTVDRLSVAVLLDHHVKWVQSGQEVKKQINPPTAEEVNSIKQLVAGVVGLKTERGDQLVVETLPFDATQRTDAPELTAPVTPASESWPERINKNKLLKNGVAVALVLLVAAGVLGFLMRNRRRQLKVNATVEAGRHLTPAEQAQPDNGAQKLAAPLVSLKSLAPASAKTDALLKEVKASLATDSTMCAQVLRVWLEEEQKA